ncbi:MAG: GrpB family protein [Candidatus Cyclobacteriaceae bacterium M3_2C_046]
MIAFKDKKLQELTSDELGQLFPIIIQDYDKNWIYLFKAEKSMLCNMIGQSEIIRIDHIGSTAIPGIKSKPTIDILLQVSTRIDTQLLERKFESNGYQLTKQPDNPPPHMTFVKGYTINGFKGQAYHVHVRYKGDWDEIRFRDYLISHNEMAKAYETLKLDLAGRYPHDREAYTNAKTAWIEKINRLTRK